MDISIGPYMRLNGGMLSGILLLLLCTGIKAEKLLPPSKDKVKIVAFGNSITAERNTIEAVFAQRLPELLRREGIDIEIINSGIGGSHTGRRIDHDLFKIPHALDRLEDDVLSHKPDITIIGFGTNDAHIDSKIKSGPSRIPIADYHRNLKYIIESVQNVGSKVVLIAPNCLGEAYQEFQNERLYKYVQVVVRLSKKYKTGLLNNYALFREYDDKPGQSMEELMLDGVHPNDRGHKMMANHLKKLIVDILKG